MLCDTPSGPPSADRRVVSPWGLLSVRRAPVSYRRLAGPRPGKSVEVSRFHTRCYHNTTVTHIEFPILQFFWIPFHRFVNKLFALVIDYPVDSWIERLNLTRASCWNNRSNNIMARTGLMNLSSLLTCEHIESVETSENKILKIDRPPEADPHPP